MYKDLVENIAKSLVQHPEQVIVMQVLDSERIILKVVVAKDDMGRLIGKDGRIIKAIRNIIRAYALKNNERVSVDVVENKG